MFGGARPCPEAADGLLALSAWRGEGNMSAGLRNLRIHVFCCPPGLWQPATNGMVKTITLIYKENGVFRGLYRGMSINYLRAVPMAAVSFSTYEVMKQLLGLDTGMKIT
ncbi:hypothetical protein PR048_006700 [Dryococelus australis]|uniref:Uncharacterized protein n=1 Tax=Dryococelus australis TaxID=614101 RepID=A0ABQ9IBN3_9NEOP|nr:hypothetical protein PR048_006700 [Dryococelus australis]